MPDSRSFRIASALVLLSIAAGFAFYLPLLGRLPERREAFVFFLYRLLPWALGHTGILLLLNAVLKFRARGSFLFWGASAAIIIVIGGWQHAKGLLLIALIGVVFGWLGNLVARAVLPQESRGWGVSLGLGILCVSLVAAFLAWGHVLKWWVISPLLIPPVLLEIRRRPWAAFPKAWAEFSSRWNTALALALQGLFLLVVFVYVGALAPETQSDALRSYLPYARQLRLDSGFADVPYQWAYIIPQAGVTYAASVLVLFRERALQLSSFLVWLALIGVICRRKTEVPLEARVAVAVVVASCPVVLWVAPTLMQDCFTCLTVAMLAIICLEGRDPGSRLFWIAAGACAGVAWAAKYSTLAYAVPLLLAACLRSYRGRGPARTASGLVLASFGGALTLAPWLVHTYRQSGNPVFPFLLKVFPAPLWPLGVGFSNLDNFRLPPGPRGWFLWLTDLTYNTSRFVEGPDGKLGITLLAFFLLSLLAFWKGTAIVRTLIASAFLGTALLISLTAYLRYWMPGLWLVAMALAPAAAALARSPRSRVLLSAAAAIILASQAFSATLSYWTDPRGWPWRYYSGSISSSAYVGARGLDMLARLQQSWGRQWPRVWYTSYDEIGRFNVRPMEVAIWELALHRLEPRSKIQYLCSARCSYWVVDEDSLDARWLKEAGIGTFFWDDRLLVASDGPVRVYRMLPEHETMSAFDGRARPGSDLLLNGAFDAGHSGRANFWLTDGSAQWLPLTADAESGGCFRLDPGGSVHQYIPLPPGLETLEFHMSARSIRSDRTTRLRWDVVFRGFEKDPAQIPGNEWPHAEREISRTASDAAAGSTWTHYQAKTMVPAFSSYAVVYVSNPDGGGGAFVDGLHLYCLTQKGSLKSEQPLR